nr:acyltransferase [Parabacteroides goldsteinii]
MSESVAPKKSSATFIDSKPHYELLDGLRGVAALLVLWYHVHEGFAFAEGSPVIKGINHGYLAVDFFFMLSGFVIGYAYDDRWKTNLTLGNFFKRRLIRLHPMVVLGALLGAVCFFLQGSVQWNGTHIPIPTVIVALLCALFFIPVVPGANWDIRGNAEAFPLNGPAWSLFFEYSAMPFFWPCFLYRKSVSTASMSLFASSSHSPYWYGQVLQATPQTRYLRVSANFSGIFPFRSILSIIRPCTFFMPGSSSIGFSHWQIPGP